MRFLDQLDDVIELGGGDGIGGRLEFGAGVFVGDGVATEEEVGSLDGVGVGIDADIKLDDGDDIVD